MGSSNSDFFQRKRKGQIFVLNRTLSVFVGAKRQEIGSDCYGTKIGPHEGEQSSQFVHSRGVCRDVVLSVLMLEESRANCKGLLKVSVFGSEALVPLVQEKKVKGAFLLFETFHKLRVHCNLHLQPKLAKRQKY